MLQLKHIPSRALSVQKPPPSWFGNKANDKHWPPGTNWLESRFHFSFADYRNPHNPPFGVLRVLNDDQVQGNRGFGEHPHRDMEIVTYIVSGALTHADSHGNVETLGRGSVQFMSAGTGIYHSERNQDDSPLRFLQIWIDPRRRGLQPNYGGHDGTTERAREARRNKLSWLVGDAAKGEQRAPVTIQQDVNIYAAELDAGQHVSLSIGPNRQAYLVCVEGTVEAGPASSPSGCGAGSALLEMHDAAEIRGSGELKISAASPAAGPNSSAHVLLIEMAEGPGGRSDL